MKAKTPTRKTKAATTSQGSLTRTNNFMAKEQADRVLNEMDKTMNALANEEKEAALESIQNGLSDAILGFNTGSIGTQLSQVETIFVNLRWYLISNMRQPLSQAYAELGLVRTIVDVPVDDAFRGGIEIKSKQLDEQQIQELNTAVEREKDLVKVAQANKWNRLYGGAGVIIMTDADPTEPFDVDEIGPDTPLEFKACDMWELYWDKQNTEGYQPNAKLAYEDEYYSYYGTKIHKSRVMKLMGIEAPSFIRPRLRGWGLSVVEAPVRSINQYLKASNLNFEVLDEFKLDIFKIKNLTGTLLTPQGESQVRKRIALANHQKNFQNAIVMDSEDDYDHKQLSFAGLAEAGQGIRMQVAADLRMPLTKIFGISAAGFSSGEDDIENYNAMIESEIREKSKFEVLRVIEIRCQKLFGMVPDDLEIDFKPLRILSAEQEENVKTQKFARLLQARQAGEMSSKEFKEACNRDALLTIQVDTSVDTLPTDSNGGLDEKKEITASKIPETKMSDLVAPEAPEVKNSISRFFKRGKK